MHSPTHRSTNEMCASSQIQTDRGRDRQRGRQTEAGIKAEAGTQTDEESQTEQEAKLQTHKGRGRDKTEIDK